MRQLPKDTSRKEIRTSPQSYFWSSNLHCRITTTRDRKQTYSHSHSDRFRSRAASPPDLHVSLPFTSRSFDPQTSSHLSTTSVISSLSVTYLSFDIGHKDDFPLATISLSLHQTNGTHNVAEDWELGVKLNASPTWTTMLQTICE